MPENSTLQTEWLSELRGLHAELPTSGMALVRIAWPDISIALRRGHTLKTIHRRLSAGGLQVSYSTLARYVNRIRYAEVMTTADRAPNFRTRLPSAAAPTPAFFDPLAGAMAALNKPRYDIRQAMADGDPTKRTLV